MTRPQRRNKFDGLKSGSWSPEEDQKLSAYIDEYGHGNWRALPEKAGLQRCGKSCRLRWNNYLRPDIKRGNFSLKEEQTIIQLHALLGNKWSIISTHLPKRTDNEIKNYWNTHLTKRLHRMGIDPMTHKPKTNVFGSSSSQSANDIILSHMAQWESTRLEAEARLARQSKLMSNPLGNQLSSLALSKLTSKTTVPPAARPQCLDVLKASQGVLFNMFSVANNCLPSPTSTLNFPENLSAIPVVGVQENSSAKLDFAANNATCNNGVNKDSGNALESVEKWKQVAQLKERPYSLMAFHEMTSTCFDDNNIAGSFYSFEAANENADVENTSAEAFSSILDDKYNDQNIPVIGENTDGSCGDQNIYEQDMDYWNTMLRMVDSSQSDSALLFSEIFHDKH